MAQQTQAEYLGQVIDYVMESVNACKNLERNISNILTVLAANPSGGGNPGFFSSPKTESLGGLAKACRGAITEGQEIIAELDEKTNGKEIIPSSDSAR